MSQQQNQIFLLRLWLVCCLAVAFAACDRPSQSDASGANGTASRANAARMNNPVESKDGLSYIPIDDTAFLIPEKT